MNKQPEESSAVSPVQFLEQAKRDDLHGLSYLCVPSAWLTSQQTGTQGCRAGYQPALWVG